MGFMGSGKSTIGKLLAQELGWRFADLDEDIVAREHTSISEIFEKRGEAEFRRIEHECLAARVRQVRHQHPLVLSLGGGAFPVEANRALLADAGISIWLDCSFERVKRRVAGFAHRPLARDPEAFRKLFAGRRASYALADYRIRIRSDNPERAVRAIMELPGVF